VKAEVATMEAQQKLAQLKRERAAVYERLARTWEDPAHLPFLTRARRKARVREFRKWARVQIKGARELEGRAGNANHSP
jgi:hypothetical protein